MEKFKTTVVNATQEHIDYLKKNIRPIDIREVYASSGICIEDALQEGFMKSRRVWVGLIENRPFCVFGVRGLNLLSDVGIPWLLGTKEMYRNECRSLVIRASKLFINEMIKPYQELINYVDARNNLSIKWLKWCGFKMESFAKPHGINGEPFFKFSMKKGDNYV